MGEGAGLWARFPVTGRRLDADDKRNGGLPSGSPPFSAVDPASSREETGRWASERVEDVHAAGAAAAVAGVALSLIHI